MKMIGAAAFGTPRPRQPSPSRMMTSERQIWEAAMLLVRRHGEDAADVAEREAQKHGKSDDELTYVVWCWIARATAELIKSEPSEREHVH